MLYAIVHILEACLQNGWASTIAPQVHGHKVRRDTLIIFLISNMRDIASHKLLCLVCYFHKSRKTISKHPSLLYDLFIPSLKHTINNQKVMHRKFAHFSGNCFKQFYFLVETKTPNYYVIDTDYETFSIVYNCFQLGIEKLGKYWCFLGLNINRLQMNS